ncbi:MAG: MarR family transcriptional regulator [Candidatus Eisenbacteria bacterium]|nr:MarR family transcriptional regulator [Candidatus Eisenbacteria bacterium]
MPSPADQDERLRRYIGHWGLFFEQRGATRMAGRLIGWLLICDPPHQSSARKAEAIGAGAASVSAATRARRPAPMIERVGRPGERSAFSPIEPGMASRLLRTRLGRITGMSTVAEEGMAHLPLDDPARI